MARPTKKEINLSKESMLSLMQEIYNELVEQRSTAIRIQNKMLTMMKGPEDMTLIGPVIEKQQKIINDCVEKKLTLSKLQAGMWEKHIEPSAKTSTSKQAFFKTWALCDALKSSTFSAGTTNLRIPKKPSLPLHVDALMNLLVMETKRYSQSLLKGSSN
jgi:hypothetical protein